MKKNWIILLFMIWALNHAHAEEDRGIAKVCANYEKVSNIMIPYTEQAWPGVSVTPTGPVPTITYFTLAARQPIVDFCSFIMQLKKLSSGEAIFATANYANKLTGNQHTEKINFLRDTYDLGTALNSFSQGDGDVSEAHSLHRRINAYLRTADKTINGEDANTFESRQERERKMSLIIRSSNKIAIFKEAINCPRPKIEEGEKNMKLYNDEIVPLYPLIDEAKDEVAYFFAQLQYLGTLISPTYEAHQEYQKKLYNIYGNGVTFKRSAPRKKSVKSAGSGDPLKRTKITYYNYSASVNPSLFSNFVRDYADDWDLYITFQIRAKGLLTNPKSVAARQFRDRSFECRRNKIEWEVRKSNPIYRYEQTGSAKFDSEVESRIKECREGKVINEKSIANLFTHYVNELKNSMANFKSLQSRVWNYESEYLGVNRNLTEGIASTDMGEITREEVKCEDNLNITEQTALKNRITAETLEMRAMMAEEITKKTIVMESEESLKTNELEKARRESMIRREENSRRSDGKDLLHKPSLDFNF